MHVLSPLSTRESRSVDLAGENELGMSVETSSEGALVQ
jgi:hypothetical protein